MKAFLAVTFDSLRAPLAPAFKIPGSLEKMIDGFCYWDSELMDVPEIRHHVANQKDMSYYYRGHLNRERMLKYFMEESCDTLISLDSDTIIGDDFCELLNFDFPSSMVRWAPYPFKAHFGSDYVLRTNGKPELTNFITFGALAMKREVLERLSPPYVLNPDYLSDDFYFSRRLLNHGILPTMVPGVKVGHQDRKTGIIYRYDEEGKVVGK